MKPSIEEHILEIGKAVAGIGESLETIASKLFEASENGSTIWVLGNGGSMAVAQHFVQDMLKSARIRAQCINDSSVLTAYANDHAFEYVFYAPLEILRRVGDPIVIFSCSGKSRNYIEFVSQNSSPLFAVVGMDGGFLLEKADDVIHIKSENYAVCEVCFQIVADMMISAMKRMGAKNV